MTGSSSTTVRAAAVFLACCFGVLGNSAAADAAACPNEALRTGPSTGLPDCRAFELVSPSDTNGRFLGTLNTFGQPAGYQALPHELVSPGGGSVAFLSYQSALPELRGATGVADLYVTERQVGGWETIRRLSPSGSGAEFAIPRAVSPDHLYSLETVADGLTSPLAVEEQQTTYLLGADGSLELMGLGSLASEPYAEARFLGARGEHIVFSTEPGGNYCRVHCETLKLEPDAPPTGTGAVYDRSADGVTHVVSLLPGDVTPAAGEQAFYRGTAKDGSAVAFEVEQVLYLRVDNTETLQVAAGKPTFAGVSDEGRYVFYVAGGNIHRFDAQIKADIQVNSSGDGKVVNISGDGSHVYFVSESQIGGEGEAGKPNIYAWSASTTRYIATVAASDLEHTSGTASETPDLTNWTLLVTNRESKFGFEQGPGNESSRTNPNGKVLVFESRAQLTSYDNSEPSATVCGDPEEANEGCTEIYRYDDEDNSLACVSCNPLVEPATGDAQLQELDWVNAPTIIHNLSDDGTRVFFESTEALVSADTDGINDIYEWQKEEGGGSVLNLISSGQSSEFPPPVGFQPPLPNVLLSVTGDGEDVVFLSQDALAPGAPRDGAAQVYDARAGGGFAAPVTPTPCAEEGCRPPTTTPPPSFAGPPSEATSGAGNVKASKHNRRCRRKAGKHRRCAKHKENSGTARQLGAIVNKENSGTARQLGAIVTPNPRGGRGEGAPGAESPTKGTDSAAAFPIPSAGPFDEFGIESVGAELSTYAAGMHPDFTNEITLNHQVISGELKLAAKTEELAVSLPPGLLANPNAIPQCETIQLLSSACPIDSQVGLVKIAATEISGEPTEPIYNMSLPHPEDEVARFGVIVAGLPAFIDATVRTASDYGATATVYGASGMVSLVKSKATLWGNPADHAHDKQRLTPKEGNECPSGTACKAPGGKRESGLPPTAFMTNPSACRPMSVDFSVRSYQLPGQVFTATAPMDAITECTGLPFEPSFEAQPTSRVAGAPTGLKTTLHIPQQSTEAVNSPATATMREAKVTLPEGMQIAAGAANWIDTCSDAQIGYHEEVDAACPDASKLGTATISSPSLPHPIEGVVYQRTPTPGHQLGLWIAVDALGLHVKLPGELKPDPNTGRLSAIFSDLPQVPVEEIDLDVWGGPRAPLQNPPSCGTYTTDYSFTPHAEDPAVIGRSRMTIDRGCSPGFDPRLSAGVTDPLAGRFSPFVVDLSRQDGDQALRGFELTLPDGELAKIKGVALCPDAAASGGSCPADSRIGSVTASAGPGPDPLWVPRPGKSRPSVYLAGPYQGSPFSVITVVPAQAGPFDLGNVVVRSGLGLDPDTNRAVVKADPLPQFFEGVGLTYRHLHVLIDRPDFSLNPTDCREMQVDSTVASTRGAAAHPASRFQVEGCKRLKFKPKLQLKLRGGTKRGEYPALTAILKARKGDANIARASVDLPRSEFLAQEHIVTICTRKRFAADKCPKGSVYGKAKAWTPLLAKPLEGPVYLRSSDHPLPDMVVALGGELDVNLIGRIDSHNGGIRSTFEAVPDAPVTKFVLEMRGGKKGLLVNSRDICRGASRAAVKMSAQNGKRFSSGPILRNEGCGKKAHKGTGA